MTYKVNKGVGRSFEFKGLRAVYVFIALGGIIVSVLLYFVLGMFFSFGVSMSIVMLCALASVGSAYYLNRRFGENGLRYVMAQHKTVARVQNNVRVGKLLKTT
jgi:uncharacterized membrane protein